MAVYVDQQLLHSNIILIYIQSACPSVAYFGSQVFGEAVEAPVLMVLTKYACSLFLFQEGNRFTSEQFSLAFRLMVERHRYSIII